MQYGDAQEIDRGLYNPGMLQDYQSDRLDLMLGEKTLSRSRSGFIHMDANDFSIAGQPETGVSGVYLVKDKTNRKWIFKPTDEEPFKPPDEDKAIKNQESSSSFNEQESVIVMPTASKKIPLRNGILYGQTTLKETAAYALDHGRFAGVPRTYPVKMAIPSKGGNFLLKRGSLQEFREHISSAEDVGSNVFSVDEVHKIGILDIRLLNLDRHLGNILVSRGAEDGSESDSNLSSTEPSPCFGPTGTPNNPNKPMSSLTLTPIDHAYTLPDFRDTSDVYFEWLYWKQSHAPFSRRSLSYIKSLDPLADALRLKKLGIADGSVLTCFLAGMLLQRGAARGLNLEDVAMLVHRQCFGEEKSVFEQMVAQALKHVPSSSPMIDYEAGQDVISLGSRSASKQEGHATTSTSTSVSVSVSVSASVSESVSASSGSGSSSVDDATTNGGSHFLVEEMSSSERKKGLKGKTSTNDVDWDRMSDVRVGTEGKVSAKIVRTSPVIMESFSTDDDCKKWPEDGDVRKRLDAEYDGAMFRRMDSGYEADREGFSDDGDGARVAGAGAGAGAASAGAGAGAGDVGGSLTSELSNGSGQMGHDLDNVTASLKSLKTSSNGSNHSGTRNSASLLRSSSAPDPLQSPPSDTLDDPSFDFGNDKHDNALSGDLGYNARLPSKLKPPVRAVTVGHGLPPNMTESERRSTEWLTQFWLSFEANMEKAISAAITTSKTAGSFTQGDK